MNQPQQVKALLWSIIHEMSQNPALFSKNPDADFSRKRKLDFENLLRFLISMQGGTTAHELLKYFEFDPKVLTNSAFYQQRKKLLLEAFQYLLFHFNSQFPSALYKDKYMLVACDGCEFNIFRNANDPDTFHPPSGKSIKGYNTIHTISLYDILNKRYLDLVIQPGRLKNEFRAICELNDRFSYEYTPIFIADRGFASYNFYAHAMEKGTFFLVRAKDVNVKRLLKLDSLPDNFDTTAEIIISRISSNNNRKHPELVEQYRFVAANGTFDYIPHGETAEYPMSLRIIRFEVAEGIFQNIITNLPANEISCAEIKQLYHLRWDIEISFRDLKHTIGAINFHSKKVDYIKQEIWARLILFNFCAIITTNISIEQHDTKHVYQVNYSMAIKICHHFLRLKEHEPPPDLEALIGSYTLPIRLGRNYTRQHRFQLPASFWYRFA